LSPEHTTPDLTTPELTPADEADPSGFTQAETNLLGSKGIVRGQDGVWVHIEKEPSGRTIITRER